MSVTRKEELGIKVNIEYEYFMQLMSTMDDEELSSLLSDSQKMGNLCLKKSHEVWKIIPILSDRGYPNSLRFFEGLVQDIEALQMYCFGPEGLCKAISEEDVDSLQYFLGHNKNPHTVEYFLWLGALSNNQLIHPECLPQNNSCEMGYLEAVESLLVSGLEVDRQQGQELINSVCQCWDSYDINDSFFIQEFDIDIVKKKMRILRMLLEAGHRSEIALHNICDEKYSDLYRMPAEMLTLLLNYEIDIHLKLGIKESSAFLKACHRLSIDKIKVLADFGANVNEPDYIGQTPLEICTRACREHCLDGFTDDIIRFLHEEKGADINVICRDTGHNLLEIACSSYPCYEYREEKLAIVLYYLSRKLILKYDVFAKYLLQSYAMDSFDESSPQSHFMSHKYKELLSVLVMDNAFDTSPLLSGPAGRLVVNIFDYYNYDQNNYRQPDFDMLRMLSGAGFVIFLPDHIEAQLIESTEEIKQMTLKILKEELSRIPSLAELCRWEVRRVLGPGLMSQQKVERLPLPKPMIEYILLLDIIEEEHAQKMYDYFSGKGLNMVCVAKYKEDLYENKLGLECPECSEYAPEKLQRKTEREENLKWAAEFLEQCQEEDRRKAQGHPEDCIILD